MVSGEADVGGGKARFANKLLNSKHNQCLVHTNVKANSVDAADLCRQIIKRTSYHLFINCPI